MPTILRLILAASFLMIAQACSTQEGEAGKDATTEAKAIPLGPNVSLIVKGKNRETREVHIQAKVCLRMGQLEQFMTRVRTKEHEAIVAAEVDARNIHVALVAAGAEPGNPVTFQPKFKPPAGTVIKISVEYTKNGKTVRVPAQDWIRSTKTKKKLASDWVFGGSQLWPDPLDKTKPPYYAANDGDVICISNFETAMLDVPFSSSKVNDDLAFEANTDVIPEVDTPVVVILEPVLSKKK